MSASQVFLASPDPEAGRAQKKTVQSYFSGRFFAALAIFAALLASTTPSPLYPIYLQNWDLPQSAGTTIFSIYAVGTLLSLFLSGWLARRVADRRKILMPALILTALGAILFAMAGQVWMLLFGRFLSGMATGLITSTASAVLFNLDRPEKRARAATVSTIAFTGGAAIGPCLSSAALATNAAPLITPFLCIAVVAIIAFTGLLASAWPKTAPAGATAAAGSLAESPVTVQPGFLLLACLSVAVAWMLGSVLMATGVTLATDLFHLQIHALAGLLPAIFQLFAGIGQMISGRLRPLRAILLGCGGLAVLQLLVVLGASIGLSMIFVIAMPLCGLFYGAAFVGGAAFVNQQSRPARLSVNIATFYVVGYLANALPTFAFGYLIDAMGLQAAFSAFSGLMILLAILGTLLATCLLMRRKD